MADVNGESFGGRWRCNLSYWTSQSNTAVSVGGTCQMQSLGYGMSLSGFYAHVDVNGSTNSTENTSFYSATGGWVTKDMISHSQSFSRTHSDYSIYINACIDRTSASYYPGKSIPTAYITIPAKDHWTVAFDANGGSGAPSSQTKWRDETLTLSSTKPTRTGYTFQGWATSASGSVAYQPDASYTSNSALTLYAVWKANTWTVKFDANGGSGAPANQTKTYGVDLTLSTTKPTRALYNFMGWGTSSSSSSSSAVYQPGDKYTANADITLYAVWEIAWIAPKLNNSDCFRCNQNGVADDTGTYCRLVGDWVTDKTIKSIQATVNGVTTTISGSGKSGTIAVTLGAGALSAETSYAVKLVITDEIGSGTWNWTIAATHYILDFAPNGSVGINTPAVENYNSIDGTQLPGPFFTINETTSFKKEITGLFGKKHEGSAPMYKRLTVANRNNSGSIDGNSCGHVRLYGRIGGFTSNNSSPIDLFVPTRDLQVSNIVCYCRPEAIANEGTSVYPIVVLNSENYIEIWLASRANSYYTYDLIVETFGSRIVDEPWTSTAPTTIKWSFVSRLGNDDSVAQYNIVATSRYHDHAYPQLVVPAGKLDASSVSYFVRSPDGGWIPKTENRTSSGSSDVGSIGTNTWRFSNVWTSLFNGADGLKFFAGTKVITAAHDSVNNRMEALLFSPSDFTTITGSTIDIGNGDGVFVMNGDANANPGVAGYGSWATYWRSGNIWVDCECSANVGSFRIQYLIVIKGK